MASIKSNYLFNLLNTVSSLLFPLITFPYIARVLSAEGVGLVNFYLSIINYIIMFSSLGIPLYAIREIAKYKEDIQKRNKTLLEILSLHLILTIIGYIIVIILSITVKDLEENKSLFLLLSFNIIFTTIGCEWFYQGIEEFKYITIRGLIVKIISVILLFCIVKDRNDIMYYGVYSVFGILGGNIFNFIRLRKYVKLDTNKLNQLHPFKHLVPCLRVFVLSAITSIYLQLDTVMLGFLSNNESVGYYTASVRLTKMLMGITTSLGVVLLPRFTTYSENNNKEKIIEILEQSVGYILLISIPMVIGLITMAPVIIPLFCGNGYAESILSTQLLSPIILFISISYIYAQLVFSIGKEKLSILTGSICSIINLILNFVLIPRFQHNGAVIGTLVSELSSLICYAIIIYVIYRKIFLINKHSLLCLASASIMGVIINAIYNLNLGILTNLFFMPITGIFVYVCILFIFRDSYILNLISLITKKNK